MKFGSLDFNEKVLARLSLSKFKRFWKQGSFEAKTGVSDIEAAEAIGIKVPKRDNEGGE